MLYGSMCLHVPATCGGPDITVKAAARIHPPTSGITGEALAKKLCKLAYFLRRYKRMVKERVKKIVMMNCQCASLGSVLFVA